MTILRCGGGCGSELETADPVNHRAAYLCPRCLRREVDATDHPNGGA